MQFDWTTFALEIINFLVLLWILKRFLYKPVLDMLDARQKRINDQVQHATDARKEAEVLKEQYEGRIATWNKEQEEERRKLAQELAKERSKQMDDLKKVLADELSKERARKETMMSLQEDQLAEHAKDKAFAASANMLERLSSLELTKKIAQVFVQDIASLSDKERKMISESTAKLAVDSEVDIASAHVLDEHSQKLISDAISKAFPKINKYSYTHQPELIAGLRVSIGEHLLQANLKDELAFFKERENHVE